ncbi:hypothetical protein OAS19_01540 [Altererythrobacter sp.]|nr:hypothetical protein [Altererythrobacter sp.]
MIAAAVTIGSGFSMRALHQRRVARHARRMEDRLAAGEDRYFEELQELQAYNPADNPPWKNVTLELLSLIAGFVSIVLLLTGWN